jgi:hypothetical protein
LFETGSDNFSSTSKSKAADRSVRPTRNHRQDKWLLCCDFQGTAIANNDARTSSKEVQKKYSSGTFQLRVAYQAMIENWV